jgi:hypothetical protein
VRPLALLLGAILLLCGFARVRLVPQARPITQWEYGVYQNDPTEMWIANGSYVTADAPAALIVKLGASDSLLRGNIANGVAAAVGLQGWELVTCGEFHNFQGRVRVECHFKRPKRS